MTMEKPHTNCYCNQCFPFVERSAYETIYRSTLELSDKLFAHMQENEALKRQLKNLSEQVEMLRSQDHE